MAFHRHVRKHANFSQGSVETRYRRNKKHEYYYRKFIHDTVYHFLTKIGRVLSNLAYFFLDMVYNLVFVSHHQQ